MSGQSGPNDYYQPVDLSRKSAGSGGERPGTGGSSGGSDAHKNHDTVDHNAKGAQANCVSEFINSLKDGNHQKAFQNRGAFREGISTLAALGTTGLEITGLDKAKSGTGAAAGDAAGKTTERGRSQADNRGIDPKAAKDIPGQTAKGQTETAKNKAVSGDPKTSADKPAEPGKAINPLGLVRGLMSALQRGKAEQAKTENKLVPGKEVRTPGKNGSGTDEAPAKSRVSTADSGQNGGDRQTRYKSNIDKSLPKLHHDGALTMHKEKPIEKDPNVVTHKRDSFLVKQMRNISGAPIDELRIRRDGRMEIELEKPIKLVDEKIGRTMETDKTIRCQVSLERAGNGAINKIVIAEQNKETPMGVAAEEDGRGAQLVKVELTPGKGGSCVMTAHVLPDNPIYSLAGGLVVQRPSELIEGKSFASISLPMAMLLGTAANGNRGQRVAQNKNFRNPSYKSATNVD